MALLAAVSLTACPHPAGDEAGVISAAEPVFQCGEEGRLAGNIYGGVRVTIDWGRSDVACEGMPRPDGSGVRLRFAGPLDDGERQIAIIIAMPEFTRDAAAAEYAANVTLIEEGNGRFFSTPDLDNCICDIAAADAVAGHAEQVAVTGALFCVLPLPEVNGESSVSIPELRFSGLLDWGAS